MPTVSYTVSASADDAHTGNINNDSGRVVTTGAHVLATGSVDAGVNDLADPLFSPGSHGSNNEVTAAARFPGVAVPNAATITSASFSLKAKTSYGPGSITISFLVSAEASDNAPTFAVDGAAGSSLRVSGEASPPGNRPRTTAVSAAWDQNSVTGGTRYSIDVTSVIQEIVNRAGWASGNAIVMLVDTNTTTTQGEWQDYYSWDDATDRTNNPPQLSITYSAGGATTLTPDPAAEVFTGRGISLGFAINMPDEP